MKTGPELLAGSPCTGLGISDGSDMDGGDGDAKGDS
jgi:hypothetical protein